MAFADLKNDFVFRRIFATHPEILRRLLNDLLEREGERTIEAIEYLPSEQVPQILGAKLSILDVKCRDRAGTVFVVEARGIVVSDEVRARIEACADLATLDRWIARAASAASAEEVIAPGPEPT